MRHKFAGLHGVDLAAALRMAAPAIGDAPLVFCHDTNAFLAGECWRGNARGFDCTLGVTLGTGLGVALRKAGQFRVNELGSPAADVSIWNSPYLDGMVEDYVSARALVANYIRERPAYDSAGGVKNIARAAVEDRDPAAQSVFHRFGYDLGHVLGPLCQRFQPQAIVFGGQISKAFQCFESSLHAALTTYGVAAPKLTVGALGDAAAVYGAAFALLSHPSLLSSPVRDAYPIVA